MPNCYISREKNKMKNRGKSRIMKNYKNVIASTKCVAISIILALFLAACDDSSSGAGPDPIAEVSSSSGDDAISSSSVMDKGTSSGGGSVSSSNSKGNESASSSSEQMNSSFESGKNSSSSVVESSSSEGCSFNGRNEDGSANLTVNCCNGDTAIVMSGKYTQYYTCRDDFWLRDSIGGQDTVKPYVQYPNMEKQFASKIDYETFVDERDGQEYKIVTITIDYGLAKTRTFFAENLNYGKQIMANATEFSDSVVEKVCYNDDEWYCDNGFGGLYSWSEAMNIPKKYDTVAVEKLDTTYFDNGEYINQYIQGICPKGWHIMTEDEWRLIGGGYKINSRAVWEGGDYNDYYGFSLLPAGYSFQGKFYLYGEYAHVWQPSLSKRNSAWGKGTVVDRDGYEVDDGLHRYGYQSVRCTKDY